MGTHHKDGYSADVEGYLVVDGRRTRLAKTNGSVFVLAEPREVTPGTEGELLVIVDGRKHSRRVMLPAGISEGQSIVVYKAVAPF